MPGRWLAVTCAIGVLATTTVSAGAAAAAPRAKGAVDDWGRSFVDHDDDGVRDPADRPLAEVLGPNGTFQHVGGPRVGVVIDGAVLRAKETTAHVLVNGTVRIRGGLRVTRADASVHLASLGGAVDIAPGAVVEGNGYLDVAAYGGRLTIGDGARLSGRGGYYATDFTGSQVVVGRGVQVSVGNGYHWFSIAGDTLTVGDGLVVRGPGHALFDLRAGSDLRIERATMQLGYILVRAHRPGDTGAGRRIVIRDSVLRQTYRNGELRVVADGPGAALHLERVTITNATGHPLFAPVPICTQTSHPQCS
jgi:hypothetical protein